MTTQRSALRKASAHIEALETRSLMSGEIDHALGSDLLGALPVAANQAKAIAVQADGKVLLAGKLNGSSSAYVARFTSAGLPDTTFGSKGVATLGTVNGNYVDSLTVLANGEILLGGTSYAKLTTAGKLDTAYGGGDGVAPSYLASDKRAKQDVYVFSDGSFLELGDRATSNKNYVFKHKADGSLDTSFGSGGSYNVGSVGADETGAISVDAQGHIYVAFGHTGYVQVLRLTSAGKLDTSYAAKGLSDTDSGSLDSIKAMAVLSDGRVIVAYDNESGFGSADITVYDTKGHRLDVVPPEAAYGFDVQKITQAKDGTVFLAGTYYDDYTGDPSRSVDGEFGYTAVMHLKSDLSLDKNYSSDHDGVGGFTTAGYSPNTSERYVASAVTAAGGVVLIGQDNVGAQQVVRLTADTAANTVSFTQSATAVVVNGASTSETMTVDDYEDGDLGLYRVIRFDNGGSLASEDHLFVKNLTASTKTTLNLNGGDDTVYANEQFGFTVNGGAGNDYIDVQGAKAVINGGDGNDTVLANGNNSTVHGNGGNDDISVGVNSTAYGDDGNDSLLITDGGTLSGGAGDDILFHSYGKSLSTLLDGGAGHDTAYSTIGDKYASIEVYAQTTGHG